MNQPCEINGTAILLGQERYIFLYDDAHAGDAIKTLGRFAANPELSLTWTHAAAAIAKIRGEMARNKQ